MKVSMVITTFNRARLLERSLDRLSQLTLPDELIVIDDGGDDDTADVVMRCGWPATYLYNHNPGSTICSMARNIGVKAASHEWIITTEPELFYMTDIVAQFKEIYPHHPNKVISAGRVYFQPECVPGAPWDVNFSPNGPDPWIEWQAAIGWVAPHTALWRKKWIEEIGGWDESFPGPWGWDDTDLLTRLRINGHGQYRAPECHAIHQFHGLGADAGRQNEQHFLDKSFKRNGEHDLTDLTANEGKEWGLLTPPS